jgi:carbamoyltransferase
MHCLGFSCYYHDAAAALVSDGRVVAAAEEERFTRRKHDDSFPRHAIQFCLDRAGLAPADLDRVCFYEKPLRKLERTLAVGRRWQGRSTALVRRQLARLLNEELFLERVLAANLGYHGEVLYCEHHLSHAASAFYPSPFDDAAVLTLDGVGEWATLAKYRGHGTCLEKLAEIHYPHSLGLLYAALTSFLGFRANTDEYKVMGLAAYGQPSYLERIRRLIHVKEDGSFELDLAYFSFPYDEERMFSDALAELLGPPFPREARIDERRMNIAASLQQVLEEVVVGIARGLYAQSGCPRLCLAGGVALNGVANWRILEATPFTELFIQPAAGDSGGALGAALYACHDGGVPRRLDGEHTTLLGPEFPNEEIERLLKARGARFERLTEGELYDRTAELLAADQVVGWFQGRMEFGPRALGCRSILANPCNPRMKEILNARVKLREDFRPFAPAVLAERAAEYFELDRPSPYMLLISPVRPELRGLIPAVVHVDGTARVQTVDRAVNPRFYALIEAFAALSGVPIVLNTSFNVQGEPIVCSPEDALACFQGTDIDFLVLGDFLVHKDV